MRLQITRENVAIWLMNLSVAVILCGILEGKFLVMVDGVVILLADIAIAFVIKIFSSLRW